MVQTNGTSDGSWIARWFGRTDWQEAVVSQPLSKSEPAAKVKIRPVHLKKDGLHAQLESFVGKQVFHENVVWSSLVSRLTELMSSYAQVLIRFPGGASVHVIVRRDGKVKIQKNGQISDGDALLPAGSVQDGTSDDSDHEQPLPMSTGSEAVTTGDETVPLHNRVKKRLIPEGVPAPFLITLGVMKPDGSVIQAMYHKFRQLNRYLEFIQDVLPELTGGRTPEQMHRPIRIIDFGCGKSYLTFALYHYLRMTLGYPVRITGLDLKTDVIATAAGLAERLGWHDLTFQVGDIGQYFEAGGEPVDLVVSLHACDTATDAALIKAIGWRSKVIFAVPCCQHEVARQLKQETIAPMLSYGLFRERFSSLWTDALRAVGLEAAGYQAQMVEFIDLEHTPKNILIRAVWSEQMPEQTRSARAAKARQQLAGLTESFSVRQTLAGWILHPPDDPG